MNDFKTIGIIGGMGALACADLFYKIIELTKAKNDNENIPLIIENNTKIPDRTAFILDNLQPNPIFELVKSAKRLKASGCDYVAISCNTAHYFADEIEKQSGVKIIHIVKTAANTIKEQFPNAKKIAVLATSGTKKARIYDDILESLGYESVEISIDLQNDITKCIYDGAKAGLIDEYRDLFNEILKKIKADVFIAGCTEIPLFLPFVKGYDFIDPTLELAKQIIKISKS